MSKAKLTIVSLSYNHEKYISQTLESFVMQKTDFPFEVIIADDCSTDNSAKIIKEFAKKYPNIIKPIFREKNLGPGDNWIEALSRVKSDYVLYSDGDDYFTDPLKLQKQVDFLDANLDYSICFHPVRVFFEDDSLADAIFPTPQIFFDKKELGLEDLLKYNFMQTNSVMYRWRFNGEDKVQDFVPLDIAPGDWYLHLLHAQKGKIGFIPTVMSDYRRHIGGIWFNSEREPDLFAVEHGVKIIKGYLALEKNFPEYHKVRGHAFTAFIAKRYLKSCLNLKKFQEMKEIMDLCPDLLTANMAVQ